MLVQSFYDKLQASAASAQWSEAIALEARTHDAQSFNDPDLVRQLTQISEMGTAVLDDADYNAVIITSIFYLYTHLF